MADEITRVSVDEAKRLVDEQGYTYLDVRTEAEYAGGHPVGARNVPIMHAGAGGMKPNPDFLAVMAANYGKDVKLLVGCKAGGRSLRAAKQLIEAGYRDIVEMRAGWGGQRNAFGQVTEPGWQAAGQPTEMTTDGGAYADHLAKLASD